MTARTNHQQSHQFVRRRVLGALAEREPDAFSAGLASGGRSGGGLLAGAVLAALALAAAAGYGVLRPGDDGAWRDGAAAIVERESGARFVYRDGVLHPVANVTSARLLVGGPATASVGRAALAGVPRGAPLGIPGAPDPLPAPADLVTGAWTVCSRPAGAVVLVGVAPGGAAAPLGSDALLATGPGHDLYVVWAGRRHAVRDPGVVLAALAWPRPAAVPLAPALLNALPAGPDLGRIAVPGAGRSSVVDGRAVGDVVVVASAAGARQFGVALADGLAEITPVQADLLLAGGRGRPVQVDPSRYARAPRAAGARLAAPPFATAPRLRAVPAGAAVCATVGDPASVTVLAGDGRVPGEIPARSFGRGTPGVVGAPGVVEAVAVRPGGGAVVVATASPTDPGGALSLVSEVGIRFPVPSPDVLARLGFAGVTPRPVPAAVLAALPTGPALDPVAAGRPFP
jgi:type VII secretion protein EccB